MATEQPDKAPKFSRLQAVSKPFKVVAVDYPGWITAAIVFVPLLLWFVQHIHIVTISCLTTPILSDNSGIISVYLGLAAIAAISGGFSGVIIVFGLTPQSDLFRRFRQKSGDRMNANWVSVISSAFLAAGLSIAAGGLEMLGQHSLAATLFLIGCMLYGHSAVRSVAIMYMLLKLVDNDDKATIRAELGALH